MTWYRRYTDILKTQEASVGWICSPTVGYIHLPAHKGPVQQLAMPRKESMELVHLCSCLKFPGSSIRRLLTPSRISSPSTQHGTWLTRYRAD